MENCSAQILWGDMRACLLFTIAEQGRSLSRKIATPGSVQVCVLWIHMDLGARGLIHLVLPDSMSMRSVDKQGTISITPDPRPFSFSSSSSYYFYCLSPPIEFENHEEVFNLLSADTFPVLIIPGTSCQVKSLSPI